MKRVYLDNAATSWPKPQCVYAAMDRYHRDLGAPAGRGVYHEAVEVERQIADARLRLRKLIAAPPSSTIVFTYSGTDALNLALFGLLKAGDHVIASVAEHNSVLRPLRYLESQLRVTRVPVDRHGFVNPADFENAIRPNTRLIVLTHASNVTGAIQPVREVGSVARKHKLLYLVDAAQTVGHIPVSTEEIPCDLLAAPGHKGLLGPTGTGWLYIGPGIEQQLRPLRLGGTGSQSESDQHPDALPEKYEAGNLNVPGLIGLGQGINYILTRGVDDICRHESELSRQLIEGIRELSGVSIHGPTESRRRVGVVSINLKGYDPQELATTLDAIARVQARGGFHCAALMHQALRTTSMGGTLRLSLGPFNTVEDVETTIDAIGQLSDS